MRVLFRKPETSKIIFLISDAISGIIPSQINKVNYLFIIFYFTLIGR
jgi:hypothetical protein